ncbi:MULTISPECIES: hypothetical protein [Methylobacterium]|uniref:hypothetical protein n=1 Tax=Methylobacterium TaxID=407 RepID=UPI0011C8361D|nr:MULTISPECIES: hypothetical protein [Methylobacterium]TXN23939.1 hypothetical protein FV217_04520 [Methylobacterium sp. WL9]
MFDVAARMRAMRRGVIVDAGSGEDREPACPEPACPAHENDLANAEWEKGDPCPRYVGDMAGQISVRHPSHVDAVERQSNETSAEANRRQVIREITFSFQKN